MCWYSGEYALSSEPLFHTKRMKKSVEKDTIIWDCFHLIVFDGITFKSLKVDVEIVLQAYGITEHADGFRATAKVAKLSRTVESC